LTGGCRNFEISSVRKVDPQNNMIHQDYELYWVGLQRGEELNSGMKGGGKGKNIEIYSIKIKLRFI